MSFSIEPIRAACKANDTNLAAVERKCGISNGSIAKWENAKGTPQIGHLLLISECLNVSLEYLVFGKEKTAPNNEDGLSDAEKDFIRLFRMLPVASQDAVIQHIRGLVLLQTVRDAPATSL